MDRWQVVGLVAFGVFTLVNGVLTYVLMQHRTGLRRGESPSSGPFWAWQVNVFLHAQYDERGRRLKPWIWVVTALQLASALLVIQRV
jgi:hypothetical protein